MTPEQIKRGKQFSIRLRSLALSNENWQDSPELQTLLAEYHDLPNDFQIDWNPQVAHKTIDLRRS